MIGDTHGPIYLLKFSGSLSEDSVYEDFPLSHCKRLKLSMGNPISKLRKQIDQSDKERHLKEERMNILEKMLKSHLDTAKQEMLHGQRNDQEIHTGTIVEFTQQASLELTSQPSPDLEDAIDAFFGGHLISGFSKIIKVGVEAVLGNSSMGQHEATNMFIIWTENALLRLDGYYYRWNFSSQGVIDNVEGASGVIMMKRVIDLTTTDPQVLTWAITRQANVLDQPDQANKMIDDAISVITKVAELQKAVRDVEVMRAIQPSYDLDA